MSEEAEDDDDPEYNFLDDMDEPDQEDYRTDRAVQITSRCTPTIHVTAAEHCIVGLPQMAVSLSDSAAVRED